MAVTPTGWLYVGLIVLSALTTTILGAYAYRHRREPGATGFALTMAVLTVWTGCYVVGLLTHDPALRTLLRNVQWIGTSVYVWLLLFALEYTGHDELATPTVIGGVGLPWLVSFALVWTAPMHDLWWSFEVTEAQGLAVLSYSYGPAFWLHTAWSYVVILFASALLLRLVFVSDYLYTDQSVLVLAGIFVPLVGNVVHVVFLEPGTVIDLTPIAFALTGVAFGYALYRHRLFDLVPATRRLGRNAAIGQLETGVVIVDTRHRVVYCNEAAAPVLGCSPAAALDRQLRSLVDVSEVDFDAPDGLAEIERDGTVYEVRTSPITDRHDRTIGHTLVAHDVTARKRRERRLATQRDELETLSALNALIRGVVQALVSETDRAGIERAVCDRIVEGDLYHTACVGDVATWNGDADRWTAAGAAGSDAAPEVGRERLDAAEGGTSSAAAVDSDAESTGAIDGRASVSDGAGSAGAHLPTVPDEDHTWVVVPVVYGRTVYGAIGLATKREDVSVREQSVLGELGEAVGHAINAVSTRQLLSTEAAVELEFESTAAADPLVAATDGADCSLELAGVVPSDDHSTLAYVRVAGDVDAAASALAAGADHSVRRVRDQDDDGLLEWRATGSTPVGTVVDHGAQLRSFEATDGRVVYEVEVASDDAVRSLLDSLDRRFDGVHLLAKRECASPLDESTELPADTIDGLTDRQQEAIEAAYRAGYFDWPRESTAEEVADSMDIAPSTLHSHLRKAEGSLLAALFEPERDDE